MLISPWSLAGKLCGKNGWQAIIGNMSGSIKKLPGWCRPCRCPSMVRGNSQESPLKGSGILGVQSWCRQHQCQYTVHLHHAAQDLGTSLAASAASPEPLSHREPWGANINMGWGPEILRTNQRPPTSSETQKRTCCFDCLGRSGGENAERVNLQSTITV